MTANIIRIPNPAHEALCVAAIRQRWARECQYRVERTRQKMERAA